MAKRVSVVLSEDVLSLGKNGDLVDVAPGYARNFLLPQGKAVPVTPAVLRQVEHRRAKEAERLGTIRMLMAAMKQKEVDERVTLDDAAVIAIVDKLIKQRKDSISQFEQAGRDDLVAKEKAEVDVLAAYMPAQLSEAEVAAEVQKAVTEFFGTDPHASADYGRIVSQRHFERLAGMLNSGKVAVGGDAIADDRYISPTVLVDVDMDSKMMDEEIFGPLLPVIPVSSVNEAVSFINSRPHPLALYVFSENKNVVDMVLDQTTSGGVTVNGTLMHITNPNLPFGGVGESGMGAYHGKSSVRLFQHMKPVLKRGTKMDPSLAYPPYNDRKAKIFRKVL